MDSGEGSVSHWDRDIFGKQSVRSSKILTGGEGKVRTTLGNRIKAEETGTRLKSTRHTPDSGESKSGWIDRG